MFLNRRGYAPLTLCRACGHRIQCPNCSAWLVTHKQANKLECHHCGYFSRIPTECPECHEPDKLHACGPGVERLKEEVLEYFPTAKVEVMASDSPKTADDIVTRMINHDIDILIGTQMIAKGHHFPKLHLVGIIDADLGLEGGDLRAMERTYQVLHQVSGRAGREADLGKVIVQTYNPDNLVMQAIAQQKRDEFIEREIMARRRFEMPPFGRLATILVSGKDEREVKKYITNLSLNAPKSLDVTILGPAPAPMSFLRGQYRYRLIMRSAKKFHIQKYIKAVLAATPTARQLKVKIDIDPYSFV
jgi:primosomal protein N' (replication factor Y)